MTDEQKIRQINSEYEEGRAFLENRKIRWVNQLKLRNNLMRGDENISSTMLFSYFNRVHSNLYDPNLQIKFEPNEDSEISNVNMLNKLALSDFQEMDMTTVEYDWLWDACFFSRGYLETLNFDKKRKLLLPEVINPLVFGYDQYFEDLQSWRYYWKWISRSGSQINQLIKKKVISGITRATELVPGMDPLVWNYKVLRDQAKYVTPQGQDSVVPQQTNDGNGIYQILEHYTYFDDAKTCVWTDRDITKIIREEKLELNDDPDNEGESLWPLVIREIFKEPHSSVAISVPDIIEDKHRAQNVLLNLSYIAAKDEVTPIYMYKANAITNESQLLQRQINQHIALEDDADTGTAIQPLKKSPALSNSILNFLNILKNEAAEAVGTSQVSPVVQKGKKTATGEAIAQMVSDMTSSLQTKIIGASEKYFWATWYQRYVNNAKEGDMKIVSVTNSQFTTFENIQLTDLKTKLPPKAIVFSAKEAEYKETIERREISQQFPILQQTLPPDRMNMFLKYIWFPKFRTLDSESINLIFPKSQDELKAEQENEMLAEGILPPIDPGDNHEVHLYIHARTKNNAQKWAHVLTHEKLLAEQQKQQQASQAMQQNQGSAPDKTKASSLNDQEAAAPNKQVMQDSGRNFNKQNAQ